MNQLERDNDMLRDISFLYEISLAIGQSIDLEENVSTFLNKLIAKKNYDMVSLWIKNEFLDKENPANYSLINCNPRYMISDQEIESNHFIARTLEYDDHFTVTDKEPAFKEVISEKFTEKGIFELFRLGNLGFLKIFLNDNSLRLTNIEISQYKGILEKLSVSLQGSLSHKKALSEIAERKKAEKKLRIFENAIKSTKNGIIITDASDKSNPIIFANSTFETITGYTFEEVKGKSCKMLQGIDSSESVINKIRDAIKAKTECNVIVKNYKKNGQFFWNELRISPIFNEEGELTHFIGIQNDITRRVEAEKAMLNSNLQITSLIENITSGVLLLDCEHKILKANSFMDNLFPKLNVKEYIGKQLHTRLAELTNHFEDSNQTFALIQEFLTKAEKVLSCELKTVNNKTYELTYTPVVSENVTKWHLLQFKDVTESADYISKLRAANVRAENYLNARESFIAHLSHEIRTPMNAVLGFSHLLADQHQENLTKEQVQYINNIKNSSENMLAAINDILDYATITEGKVNITNKQFSLYSLFNQIYETEKYAADEKNLSLIAKIDEKIPKRILGDTSRLAQILLNLTFNSIKNTDSGIVELRAELKEYNEKNTNIHFTISDSRINITPDLEKNLFNGINYEGEHKFTNSAFHGLGPTIAKSLIEQLSSELKVTINEGKGIRFEFDLTFQNIKEKETTEIAISKNNISPETISESNLRILLVEDNEMNQLVVKRILKKFFITHDIANNGLEGLELTKSGKYDIILMDLSMPVMDGITTSLNIRSDGNNPNKTTPIIALTAESLNKVKDKVANSGMDDYIPKPFHPEKLLNMINKWVYSV